jgi:hypothetical protein
MVGDLERRQGLPRSSVGSGFFSSPRQIGRRYLVAAEWEYWERFFETDVQPGERVNLSLEFQFGVTEEEAASFGRDIGASGDFRVATLSSKWSELTSRRISFSAAMSKRMEREWTNDSRDDIAKIAYWQICVLRTLNLVNMPPTDSGRILFPLLPPLDVLKKEIFPDRGVVASVTEHTADIASATYRANRGGK